MQRRSMKDTFYYRKELDYLHNSREMLLQKYPKLAPFLAHDSRDPDVEKIIQSLAILTSKIHEELDNNIPFIAESLINILAPNYTNPLPSFCMQDFKLTPNCKENTLFIPRHTSIKSRAINSVKCEFKTLYDVHVYPLQISDTQVINKGKHNALLIDIEATKDILISDIDMQYIRLYLGSEIYISNTLLLWILQYTKEMYLIAYDTNTQYHLPLHCVKPLGFSKDESMLNNDDLGFSAFILLQELFFMCEKFHFIQLDISNVLKNICSKKIGIQFVFTRELPKDCFPRVTHFSLFATPVINLFATQAEPILLDHSKNGYRIFADRARKDSYCVMQVLKVKAHNNDGGRRVLKNYYSFERFEFLDKGGDFYALANKVDAQGEHYKEISFYSHNHRKETLSIDILCSNNNLPNTLRINDINEIPDYKDIITYNLTKPTPIRHVSIDGNIAWNLVSILAFNYKSMIDKNSFLSLLHTYGFAFFPHDKHFLENLSDALIDIVSEPSYRIDGFITQRGTLVKIHIDDSKFYCLGEVYKIGLVLSYFFTSFVTINSFCELHVVCNNAQFAYPIISGNKALL